MLTLKEVQRKGFAEIERLARKAKTAKKKHQQWAWKIKKEILIANPWLLDTEYQILPRAKAVRVKKGQHWEMYKYEMVDMGKEKAFVLSRTQNC